jgi:protein-disulfide isomerase
LFESSELGKDAYVKIATDLGLNTDSFTKCVDDNKYAEAISNESQGGGASGVTGTPSSFIIDKQGNATPVKGALPFDTIASALDGMIGK